MFVPAFLFLLLFFWCWGWVKERKLKRRLIAKQADELNQVDTGPTADGQTFCSSDRCNGLSTSFLIGILFIHRLRV